MAKQQDLNIIGDRTDERTRDYVELEGKFPYRPTLYLGLGGTGAQSVEKVKQLFLRYVTPQSQRHQKAGVPAIDQLYAFRAFDTNMGERPAGLAQNREWFHLGVSDLGQFYEGLGKTAFFQDWVVKDYPTGSITAGAGGFRNLGRLALMNNLTDVSKAIDQGKQQILTAAATAKTVNPKPIVFVMCSLSGGTGSGMVLDLAFLLRASFPSADIIGVIAVLDGLPQVPKAKRDDIRVNTFCALKELNAFMDGKGTAVKPDTTINYPFNVIGRMTQPFDECYLLSSHRNDGTFNLPTQPHVTSFMARTAFMMSAYSFRGSGLATPDYGGIMVNHRDRLTRTEAGTRTCYIIPGLAQVHFPVSTVAAVFVVEAARRYLKYQADGVVSVGEDSARQLKQARQLDFRSLRDAVGVNPRDPKRTALAAATYDEVIKDLMASKERVDNRDAILRFGKAMPSDRLAAIKKELQENIDRINMELREAIDTAFSQHLAKDGHQGLGALDFLQNIRAVLAQERDYLEVDGKGVEAAVSGLAREWKQVEGIVADVVTDDGLIDRLADRFRLSKAVALYVGFLNGAEQLVLDKARNDMARTLLTRLIEFVEDLEQRLSRFVHQDAPAAIKVLEAHERELHTRLYQETRGEADSAENVCSVNVLSQEWRDAYVKSRGLVPAQLLSNLLLRGCHPRSLLDLHVPERATIGSHLAQHVVDLVEPLFDEVQQWTPLDFLRKTEEIGRQKPEELIATIYLKGLQPQMEIAPMKTLLGVDPYTLVFCGGIDDGLKEKLERTDAFAGIKLSVADNQETHRMNFSSASLPVSLAGCDLVRKTLEPAYQAWSTSLTKMKRSEQDYTRSLFHCFPGSHAWPSPTRFSQGFEASKELFARALAVAEMVPVSEADRERMLKAARNPKEQGYGLFQFGFNQFWMWPFFPPNDAAVALVGKPHRLGTNVFDAWQALNGSEALQAQARAWANWFEEHWSSLYTSPQLAERRKTALSSFLERKGRATDPRWLDLWDEIAEIVLAWDIG